MANQQLIDYIKQNIQLGIANDEIRRNLISVGWQIKDIDETFATVRGDTISNINKGQMPQFSSQDLVVEKPRKMRKFFVIGISVFVLILIIGGGIYWWQVKIQKNNEVIILDESNNVNVYGPNNSVPALLETSNNLNSATTTATSTVSENVQKPVCALKLSPAELDSLAEGVSANIKALNFKGIASDVIWAADDKTIISIEPIAGSSVEVKGLKSGLAEIIATDMSVGVDCRVSVPVMVE